MLSYVLVKRNYGESFVNYEFFFCIIWENFVSFGGLLYYLRSFLYFLGGKTMGPFLYILGGKTMGPFLYILGGKTMGPFLYILGGGDFCFFGGKKSGGIFVFFGGIFVYSGLVFNMIQK
jgi:hypothetical protein